MIAIPPSNINRKMTFIRRILFLNIYWKASVDCRMLRGRPRTLPRTLYFVKPGNAVSLRTPLRILCYSHEVRKVATRIFAEHTVVE
jgi:hypothetical protein